MRSDTTLAPDPRRRRSATPPSPRRSRPPTTAVSSGRLRRHQQNGRRSRPGEQVEGQRPFDAARHGNQHRRTISSASTPTKNAIPAALIDLRADAPRAGSSDAPPRSGSRADDAKSGVRRRRPGADAAAVEPEALAHRRQAARDRPSDDVTVVSDLEPQLALARSRSTTLALARRRLAAADSSASWRTR